MARHTFKRRTPDHVTDAMVDLLSDGKVYDFNVLILNVIGILKAKNAASGGEEMIRLRCYEKLLHLASRGLVQKVGKTYKGLKGLEQVRGTETPPEVAVASAVRAVG